MTSQEIEQNRQEYIDEQRRRDRLICMAIFFVLILLCGIAAEHRFEHDDVFTRNTPTTEQH